ncbi:MAG TPA: hypothetical protein VH413_19940 [Verrucomicrobiae bacterium]|jgi:hypothetical protein|nr:hypothetical protein [Verrucomicrobiae bacterium]
MNQQSLFKKIKAAALFAFLAGALASAHAADVFFSDGFENYTLGPLDADLAVSSGGVNNFTNGAPYVRGAFFNPWWGSEPPNLIVVGAENGVTPHSGSQMVRGASTNFMTVSQDLYNIAYRENLGTPFRGNLVLDWWFYDPIGAGTGAVNYQDSISLVYYPDLPTNADYTDPFFFGAGGASQFALGAAKDQNGGFNPAKYQAEVATGSGYDGTGPGLGWFNTATTRSVGWHHARITISAVLPTGGAFVFFYIDDLSHATMSTSAPVGVGVNAIQMDAGFGTTTGYYDDVTFDLSQHAQLTMTRSKTNIVLRWPAGWVLQSAANAVDTNFTDVPSAASPYTNNYSVVTHLYRLRSANP